MFITYLVAFLIAAAAALGTLTDDRTPYWARYDAGALRTVILIIIAFDGAVGLGAAAIAIHADWTPLRNGGGRHIVNGLVYGAIAVAILRIEIPTMGLIASGPARQLFRFVTLIAATWLDRACARAVPRKLAELLPTELCTATWDLFERHHRPDPKVLAADVVETTRDLEKWQGTALKPLTKDPDRDPPILHARSYLRHYCEQLIIERQDATIVLGADGRL